MVGTCAENADKLTATSGMKMESPGKTQKRPTQRRLVMILREGCDRACMASDGKDRAAMHSGGELCGSFLGHLRH